VTAVSLLEDLQAKGVTLRAVGSRLRVEAPRGALTEQDKAGLARHKAELLGLLRSEGNPAATLLPPAEALLDELLDLGATFEFLDTELIWFGPASTVTQEMRAKITRMKPELIAILKEMPRRSRRIWGEPRTEDWLGLMGGEQ